MNLQYNAEADEHILVCLSSAPSNSKIIRTAALAYSAFYTVGRLFWESRIPELLSDDYDFYIISKRKVAESKHLFLLKEARIRDVKIK